MGEKNIKNKEALFLEIKDEFQELLGKHKDNKQAIVSELKDSRVFKNKSLIDFGTLRGQERKDAKNQVIEIVYNHFTKEKKVEAPVEDIEETNRDYIAGMLEQLRINVGGGGQRSVKTSRGNSLTVNAMFRKGLKFDPSSIVARNKQGRRPLKPDAVLVNLKNLKGKNARTIRANFKNLIETIRERYAQTEDDTIEYVQIDLTDILDKNTMTDLSKRKSIYDYWKGIYEKFPDLSKAVKELADKLEKENTEDKTLKNDIDKFVKVANTLGDKGENINYISEVSQKEINVGDVDGRAFKALKQFFAQLDMLATKTDESGVDIFFEAGFTDTGERKDSYSMSEQLATDKERDEMEDLGEEVELDPLSILYLKRDLNEIAEVFSDHDFEYTVRDLYYKMITSKEKVELIAEQGMEELIEKLLETKKVITKYETDIIHLPVFLFESQELRQDYGDEAKKAGKIKETINDFFRAFADLLEEVRTTFTTFADIQQFGREPKGVKPQKPEMGYETTSEGLGIRRYIYGQEGRKGRAREIKSFQNIMGDINKVGELIAELFVAPMNLPSVNAGEKLPFSINGHLRIISAIIDFKGGEGKIEGGGFLPYKVMSKLVREQQLDFIKKDDLEQLIPFLKSINTGEIFSSIELAESKAEDFKDALLDIYQKEKGMEKVIDRDIASIFGAINKITNKVVLEEFEGVNASEAYEKTSIDNVTEITPVMVLVDALEQAKKNEALRLRNKPLIETIDEFLAEAKKLSPMKKSEIHARILEAHDSLRILKGKEVYYATRNENNFEHVEGMLTKMQKEHNLDMSASELINIVNEIDSFDSISKSYGISNEHVYLIKANFR
tara:strand:- start:2625 stop:5150 length:2526 start_codon:yes stop_codon:yes gene_type:complete